VMEGFAGVGYEDEADGGGFGAEVFEVLGV